VVAGTPLSLGRCRFVCFAMAGFGVNRGRYRVWVATSCLFGTGSMLVATLRFSAVTALTMALSVVVRTLLCRIVRTVVRAFTVV
jgi:hypothetical protein